MWIWTNRPSSKGSKLLFPVIKAIKIKSSCLFPNFLISVSSFCLPSFTHGPCNYWSFEFRPRGTILESIFAGCFRSLFTNPFPAFRASCWLRHLFPLKEKLLTLCDDESYFTRFAHYSHVPCSGPSATASVCCCDATSSVSTSSKGIWIWSRREKIRPFRLVRSKVLACWWIMFYRQSTWSISVF